MSADLNGCTFRFRAFISRIYQTNIHRLGQRRICRIVIDYSRKLGDDPSVIQAKKRPCLYNSRRGGGASILVSNDMYTEIGRI